MAFSLNPFKRFYHSEENPTENGNQAVQNNSNYNVFRNVNNEIDRIVASRSVISREVEKEQTYANPVWQQFGLDSDFLVMPVATNKKQRIQQYRSMANYPECDWCLDEIADEFIHEDINGNFIKLTLPDNKENLNETRKNILQEQFKYFINLFRFKEEGYNLIKRFLIEGELAWENVIDPKNPDLGIRGVKFLQAEYFENLIDVKTNRPAGILFDTKTLARDIHEILSNNFNGSTQIFNAIAPSYGSFLFDRESCVPLLFSQLTYISLGSTSSDGLITYSMMEKVRESYHQLALLQQAMVILRVTRAPERLLFNVSTGNMNQAYADEFVRNFANSLKAKKVAQPNGDISQIYNPVSMLESYVFGKSNGSDGTSVESVGSSADYEQISDIEYFLRRLMKQFKVPFSRYKTPENAMPAQDQLSYEEHSFLRMIVRLQRRFALGFKNSFITHLKLRDIWDKYQLKDEDIQVELIKPGMYELFEQQKILETQMDIYNKALGDDKEFSKINAMKKYLGYSDDDIEENYKNLIKEKQLTEFTDYIGGQVSEKKGLAGWDPPIKFKADYDAENKEGSEDKGEENGEEGEESGDEGGEEAEAPEAADTSVKSEPEPPPATFGLG